MGRDVDWRVGELEQKDAIGGEAEGETRREYDLVRISPLALWQKGCK